MTTFSVLSLFSGAGGLDLGLEEAGFSHIRAVDIDPWAVATLNLNRPQWNAICADVRELSPAGLEADVISAGFPCQGFSLGGLRDPNDARNLLYKEIVRISRVVRPRAIIIENVLNLRTMMSPVSRLPFAEQIAADIRELGYDVRYDVLKVCHYGAPQTRRRFVFVAFRGGAPSGYQLPEPGPMETIRRHLYDLAQGSDAPLPNHNPTWGFASQVHRATGEIFDPSEDAVPVRFSRTASDGFPIRSFDEPFPAVDTATVWGWAQGNVRAARVHKDRQTSKFIRNPAASVTLWRVQASRLRAFTHREYARLQTFPDTWEFRGANKRDIHLQIGNAVPVAFARRVAENIRMAFEADDRGDTFPLEGQPRALRLF